MQKIPRFISQAIQNYCQQNKVLILFGTRRVGKTFLIQEITQNLKHLNPVFLNGEDWDTQNIIANRTIGNYQRFLRNTQLLVIDEAQAIPNIGAALKLMIDSFPNLTIIAIGSSSFDLGNRSGEPLTGRKIDFRLFSVAQIELQNIENLLETRQRLAERLIFGSYPEVINTEIANDRITYLRNLVNSYLFKDILTFEKVQNAQKIFQLLQLLAFQVGSEVSLNELGVQLGMSKNTVERYLDLLSQVFVIFRLGAFSNNLRKEISKSSKWYFYDNGVRNAIINDFRAADMRQDIGQLWENYVISERVKWHHYTVSNANYYFWRSYSNVEIDFVEQFPDGKLACFEMKWKKKTVKMPSLFAENYPHATFEVVHQDNYLDFITPL